MRLGGTSVIMEHFDAEEFLRLVAEAPHHPHPARADHVRALPQAARRGAAASTTCRRCRCAIHAAAPCPIPVKEKMIEWWGPIIWEYYGGTEGNGLTMCNSAEWLAHKGTVGRAVVGELQICDDDGNEVPAGEAGTVYFAGGRAFEYHNDPRKTAESRNARRLDDARRRGLRRCRRLPATSPTARPS